jgi:hypothetical protein
MHRPVQVAGMSLTSYRASPPLDNLLHAFSDLAHVLRRSFVTRTIREPASVRYETWHEQDARGSSLGFVGARFDAHSANQGCRHSVRRHSLLIS